MFGIVQGGVDADLRRQATRATVDLGFDGYAIGGMAVGEPKPAMYDLTELVAEPAPGGPAPLFMGVGKPEDLVHSVARGVDMFDCVLPTRNARNGQAFTADGPLTLKQARYTRDQAPLDAECGCYACRGFSRAYLRHLFMAGELLSHRLLTLHNVTFFRAHARDARGDRGGCVRRIPGSVLRAVCRGERRGIGGPSAVSLSSGAAPAHLLGQLRNGAHRLR
mgnify:CR=1 FL=1